MEKELAANDWNCEAVLKNYEGTSLLVKVQEDKSMLTKVLQEIKDKGLSVTVREAAKRTSLSGLVRNKNSLAHKQLVQLRSITERLDPKRGVDLDTSVDLFEL